MWFLSFQMQLGIPGISSTKSFTLLYQPKTDWFSSTNQPPKVSPSLSLLLSTSVRSKRCRWGQVQRPHLPSRHQRRLDPLVVVISTTKDVRSFDRLLNQVVQRQSICWRPQPFGPVRLMPIQRLEKTWRWNAMPCFKGCKQKLCTIVDVQITNSFSRVWQPFLFVDGMLFWGSSRISWKWQPLVPS